MNDILAATSHCAISYSSGSRYLVREKAPKMCKYQHSGGVHLRSISTQTSSCLRVLNLILLLLVSPKLIHQKEKIIIERPYHSEIPALCAVRGTSLRTEWLTCVTL